MSELIDFRIEADRATLGGTFLAPGEGFKTEATSALQRPVGNPLEGAHFIEPVSIAASVTLAAIAYRLIEHWLGRREFGVQIDARTIPATISNIAGVPAGFVVIIDSEGKVSNHPSSNLTSGGLAALLANALKR